MSFAKDVQKLLSLAEKLREKAARIDAEHNEPPGDYASRLGTLLHARQTDVARLVGEWGKEGSVRALEFRQHCKKLGVDGSDHSAIDALFQSLDAQRVGALTHKQLRAAFKGFVEVAATRAARLAAAQSLASRHRQRAEQAQMAAEAAETAEEAERRLERMSAPPLVDARLGALLHQRNLKAGELLGGLDRGDGTASRRELIASVRAAGLGVSEEEGEELCERLGAEGAAVFDLGVVGKALRRVQEAAAHADANALAQAKTCGVLRKACRMQQEALYKALEQDARGDAAAEVEGQQAAASEQAAADAPAPTRTDARGGTEAPAAAPPRRAAPARTPPTARRLF